MVSETEIEPEEVLEESSKEKLEDMNQGFTPPEVEVTPTPKKAKPKRKPRKKAVAKSVPKETTFVVDEDPHKTEALRIKNILRIQNEKDAQRRR